MPWVHLDDVVGLALHAAATAALSGPLNVAAPTPATNAELTRALGRALHRPAILPVPAAALRLAFGELAGVLLASQRVVPEVALRTGYRFRFEDLDAALRDALGLNGRGAARTP
jgi:NAD dependent epimerase/dehydratase family enzyme